MKQSACLSPEKKNITIQLLAHTQHFSMHSGVSKKYFINRSTGKLTKTSVCGGRTSRWTKSTATASSLPSRSTAHPTTRHCYVTAASSNRRPSSSGYLTRTSFRACGSRTRKWRETFRRRSTTTSWSSSPSPEESCSWCCSMFCCINDSLKILFIQISIL